MKLLYYTQYDILRPRTNQIGDMRICEGFAENGVDVELIVPYVYRKDNVKKEEVFDMYGVKTKFKITYLNTNFKDIVAGAKHFAIINMLNSRHFMKALAAGRNSDECVMVMSRNSSLLIPHLLIRKLYPKRARKFTIIHWAHEIKMIGRFTWVYRNADAIIGTNSTITEHLEKYLDLDPARMEVSLNPITEHQLKTRVSKAVARKHIGYTGKKPLVVYTGKLFKTQREAHFILDAAARLPQYQFLLTGGKPDVVAYYEKWCRERKVENVTLTGYIVDYTEVIYYQTAADALISYYTKDDHFVEYNFPNKVCEYMLAGNPIITPEYPATRDVLNEQNAIFVNPEDLESLISGIQKAIENKEEGERIGKKGLEDVKEITFKKRALVMKNFMQRIGNC
ncbi:MAG: glycosyltransferase [Bacteroidia bacterium]